MNKYYVKKNYFYKAMFYQIVSLCLVLILFFIFLFQNVNGTEKCTTIKETKKEVVNNRVVFLGDSITDYFDLDLYFPNLRTVNSGIRGNKTKDILDNINNRVFVYKPSKVVLLIGINDILHEKNSDYVFDDIKSIISKIKDKFPECEIYIQSIYPINEDCEKNFSIVSDYKSINSIVIKNNKKIKKYCKDNNYTYIDMHKELLDDNNNFDKKYTDDGLHPNDRGYFKIRRVLKKYF